MSVLRKNYSDGRHIATASHIKGAINIDMLSDVLNETLKEYGESPIFELKDKYKTIASHDENTKDTTSECHCARKKEITMQDVFAGIKEDIKHEINYRHKTDDDNEDIYICDCCSVARRTGFKYHPDECDTCDDCSMCQQYVDGDCDGCGYSTKYNNGQFYRDIIGLEDCISQLDINLLKSSTNNEMDRKKGRRFSVRR